MLADLWRWSRAWQRAGLDSAPWPIVRGAWPTVSFEFTCPAGWNMANLEGAAERIALATGSPWWELSQKPGRRWSLLLDASDWSSSPSPPLCRTDGVLSVPIGIHPDGPAVWDLRRAPHLLVAGATGSGKSSLLRNIVASLPIGWCWRVVVVDPKELDFSPLAYEIEVSGLSDAASVLGGLADDLRARKNRLAASACDHWTALPPRVVPTRPVLVVIDEAADLLGGVGLSKPEAQCVRDAVSLLARQGRACGFHVVAAFTRPDTDAIPGAVRDQFAARVALGPLSPDGVRMLFGSHRASPLPDAIPGTGLALGLDGSQRLRRVRVPWATVDDVRRRHGCPGFGITQP